MKRGKEGEVVFQQTTLLSRLMLRDVLSKIGNEYPHARTQPFSKHPLAQFIRSEATQELRVA